MGFLEANLGGFNLTVDQCRLRDESSEAWAGDAQTKPGSRLI